jgi:hypothetical protein
MDQLWKEPLSPEKEQELITKVADQIVRRKMAGPAMLFLGMHKPFGNVGANAMVVLTPFLAPFMGLSGVDDYSQLMSKPQNWDRVMDLIENSRENPPMEQQT